MPINSVTLTGRHVRLEPLSAVHLPALAQHADDMELWQFMPYARANPRDSLRAWAERAAAERTHGGLFFAVIDVSTDRAVGGTSLFDYSESDRRLEIGATWLGRAVWRTAINTECKRLLLGHAFEVLGVNRVQLKTDSRNERSQRAIDRLGAKKEGVLRNHMVMPDGYVRHSVLYSIVASEWPVVKVRLDAFLDRS